MSIKFRGKWAEPDCLQLPGSFNSISKGSRVSGDSNFVSLSQIRSPPGKLLPTAAPEGATQEVQCLACQDGSDKISAHDLQAFTWHLLRNRVALKELAEVM